MDKTPVNKDTSTAASLLDLLKQYTTRVDDRETIWKDGTRACRQQQKVQTDEIEKLKDTVTKLQTKASSILDTDQQITTTGEIKSDINYKMKWEESEVKYRLLETKFHQLETGTIKQLQDKIARLEQDYNQMKIIKERIAEICSCRQLTNIQIEQLKLLIHKNTSIETIANKNDFYQQTRKLREVLTTHNNELLSKLDQMINKKRKRDQIDNELTDDDDDNH